MRTAIEAIKLNFRYLFRDKQVMIFAYISLSLSYLALLFSLSFGVDLLVEKENLTMSVVFTNGAYDYTEQIAEVSENTSVEQAYIVASEGRHIVYKSNSQFITSGRGVDTSSTTPEIVINMYSDYSLNDILSIDGIAYTIVGFFSEDYYECNLVGFDTHDADRMIINFLTVPNNRLRREISSSFDGCVVEFPTRINLTAALLDNSLLLMSALIMIMVLLSVMMVYNYSMATQQYFNGICQSVGASKRQLVELTLLCWLLPFVTIGIAVSIIHYLFSLILRNSFGAVLLNGYLLNLGDYLLIGFYFVLFVVLCVVGYSLTRRRRE